MHRKNSNTFSISEKVIKLTEMHLNKREFIKSEIQKTIKSGHKQVNFMG